jgi:hypothetical protein
MLAKSARRREAASEYEVGRTGRDKRMKSTFLIVLTMLLLGCRSRDTLDESKSEPARLADVIGQADRIVVFEHHLKDAKILFNTTVRSDLDEFKDAATIVWPPTGSFCICLGVPTIRLYRGHSELVQLKNFNGQKIGCPFWTNDVLLKAPEKWRAWFENRRIPLSGRGIEKWEESRRALDQAQGHR